MPRSKPPCIADFRRHLVNLVRAGRMPEILSKEYGPPGQLIRSGAQDVSREEDAAVDELTTAACEELNRLRKENRQLREERDILRVGDLVIPQGLRAGNSPGGPWC
ncbi:hypothetical protein CEDDRAFT_00846 [Frankia sp. CeD]|nr:hypothetical protein CEDDRAFT_00846 [Frankia sp. CeD]